MKILSVDTSSKICSVAVLEDDNVVNEINLDNGMTHSENLMPIIAEILEKNNMKLADINLIACCVGPGSFTGIRIGVSSVKAMAEVKKIPVASVTSLEILARIDTSSKVKVAMIDAKNNQVYCGIFDENYNKLEELFADDILIVIETVKKYENMIFIGDGAIIHKDLILQNISNASFCKKNEQNASFGGKIAYKKYLEKNLETADSIMPIYLRKSQAERMKKQK